MANKQEYEHHLREMLGEVDETDTEYLDGSLRIGVSGASEAEHGLGFVIVLGILEFLGVFIVGAVTDLDPNFLLFFAFYALTKDFIIGCIFSNVSSKVLGNQKEWNRDKRLIADTKVCLGKMGVLKSDIDLSDYEFRKPSKLDEYDIRRYM